MNESGVFQAPSGRRYKFSGDVQRDPVSTRSYTPSVTYARQERPKPKILKAVLTSKKNTSVAVKYLEMGKNPASLRNEQHALQRLAWLANLPGLKIAPSLYEPLARGRLPFDAEDKHQLAHYIVYEWFEDHSDIMQWENLAVLLKNRGTLTNEELIKLHAALARAVRWMHRVNVFHGDLKDEHILVAVRNEEPNFSQIRLIDFGLSYLENTADWGGASIGFCPPFFWNPENRKGRTVNQLRWLDWYAVDAILYYARTGQCFPAASPAYRDLLVSNEIYDQLKTALIEKYEDQYLERIIQRLSDYAYRLPTMNVYQAPKIAAGAFPSAINGALLALFTIGVLMQWVNPLMLGLLPLFLWGWLKLPAQVNTSNHWLPILGSGLVVIAHFLHGAHPAMLPLFFAAPVLLGIFLTIAHQMKQPVLYSLLPLAIIAPIATPPVMVVSLALLAGYQFGKLKSVPARLWVMPILGGAMTFFSSSAMPEHFLHRFPAPVHHHPIALVVQIVNWIFLFMWANWVMRKSESMPDLGNFLAFWVGGFILFVSLPLIFGAILQIPLVFHPEFGFNLGVNVLVLMTLAVFIWNYEGDTSYEEDELP